MKQCMFYCSLCKMMPVIYVKTLVENIYMNCVMSIFIFILFAFQMQKRIIPKKRKAVLFITLDVTMINYRRIR